jgi:tRNA(Arg) A34 adenosine deaminase TadA
MTPQQVRAHLHAANEVALEAQALGKHPFGAVLIGPDNESVLLRQGNIDTVNHAESTLARQAASAYPPEYLARCTLVTTFEPCAMCAGTIYWASIGRVVYGASETDLLALTGNHPENPTLSLPCREVFATGQRATEVLGPVDSERELMLTPHRAFWSSRGTG